MAVSGSQGGPSSLFGNQEVAEENWRYSIACSDVVLLVLSREEERSAWGVWSCMVKDEGGMVNGTAIFCGLGEEGWESLVVIAPWVDLLCSKQHDRLLKVHGMCIKHDFVVAEPCMPIEGYLENEGNEISVRKILDIALQCICGFIVFQEMIGSEVRRGMDVIALYVAGDAVKVTADVEMIALGVKSGVEKLGKRLQYMAPEVLSGKPANKSSDAFCFGILLWSLVTRQTSWSTVSSAQLVEEIQRGVRPRIAPTAQIGGQQLPPEYWDLAQKCWSAQCEQRPSMNAIKASVEEMIRRHSDRDSEEEMNWNSNSAPSMFGLTVPISMQSSEEQQSIQTRFSGEVGDDGLESSFTSSTPQEVLPSTSTGFHGLSTILKESFLRSFCFLRDSVRYGHYFSMSQIVSHFKYRPNHSRRDPLHCVNGTPAPQKKPALGVPVPSGFHPYQSSPFSVCPSLEPLIEPPFGTNKYDPWKDPQCVAGVSYHLEPNHWSAVRGYILNSLLQDDCRDPLWADIVVIAISCEETPCTALWLQFLSAFFYTPLSIFPQSEHWRALLEWLLKPVVPKIEENILAFTDLEEPVEDLDILDDSYIFWALGSNDWEIGLTETTDSFVMRPSSGLKENLGGE